MKHGELETKTILERKGIAFDESYYDDNSSDSMPDFKYLDENQYLEVTHTVHNNAIATHQNRFNRKCIAEQLAIMEQASAAKNRLFHYDYPQTQKGQAQFEKDRKLLKSHLGYDVTKLDNQFSEFDCDLPIIECSTDNILQKLREKGKKHNKGDTDLFIFVLEDEFEVMIYLIESGNQNTCYTSFFNTMLQSPFSVVYVCVWCFESQTYETENPTIMKFEKTDRGGIRARKI